MNMRIVEKTMLQVAVASGCLAAWLLICDAAVLPARFTFTSQYLHWQIFLVLGAVLLATRDQLTDFRCRCCGSHEDLSTRALVTSRELLCKSCLTWDPQIAPAESVQPEYSDLLEALKQ